MIAPGEARREGLDWALSLFATMPTLLFKYIIIGNTGELFLSCVSKLKVPTRRYTLVIIVALKISEKIIWIFLKFPY